MSNNTNAINFLHTLSTRPGFFLGKEEHLLHRFHAFVQGLKWAADFNEPDMKDLARFLRTLDSQLSKALANSASGVGWFESILEGAGGNEELAFDRLMKMVVAMWKSDCETET